MDQIGQLLGLAPNDAARDQFAQSPDNFAGAHRARLRIGQRVLHRVHVAAGFRRQHALRPADIIRDRRERLVEFMRQGRCHRPHRAQPRDVDQLGLDLAQLFFGRVARVDILQRPIPAHGSGPRIDQRRPFGATATIAAVALAQAILHIDARQRRERMLPPGDRITDIFGMDEVGPAGADRLFDGGAGHGVPPVANGFELAGAVRGPWDQTAQLDRGAIEVFAFAAFLIGGDALRHCLA